MVKNNMSTNDSASVRITPLPSVEEFLLQLQTNNFSKETVYNYERDLESFAYFLATDARIPFSRVTKRTFDQYKAYLISIDRKTARGKRVEKQLSASSINRMLSSLRRYLKYLIDLDEPVPVPPEAIKLVRLPRQHPRVAELEALVRLIECPEQFEPDPIIARRNRAMLETLFATGMRISELISLNRDQLDNTGRIFIRGKGKKDRFVYLTERSKSAIQRYLNVRGDLTNPSLFIPRRGKNSGLPRARISANYLQMKIKQYRERLEINVPTSAHSLRHGFATYLAEQGANPAAIQILLGHESLQTTTRYVHASDSYAEKTHKKYHPLK